MQSDEKEPPSASEEDVDHDREESGEDVPRQPRGDSPLAPVEQSNQADHEPEKTSDNGPVAQLHDSPLAPFATPDQAEHKPEAGSDDAPIPPLHDSPLAPIRESRHSMGPVLTVTKSFALWKKVKWPLTIASVVLFLTVIGIIANNVYVKRHVEKVISLAAYNERSGEIKQLVSAAYLVSQLYEEYPDRPSVRLVYAWQLMFNGEFTGPRAENLKQARELLETRGKIADEHAHLRDGMVHYLDDNYQAAIEAARKGAKLYPESPRFALLQALARSQSEKVGKALAFVKSKSAEHPEYIPLVLLGLKISFEKGSPTQHTQWTKKMLRVSPDHIYGKLMLVAARLPVWGGSAISNVKLTALSAEMSTLRGEYKGGPPMVAQLGTYLEGRLAFHTGDFNRAKEIFGSLVEANTDAVYVAWLGQTIYTSEGADAASATLAQYPEAKSQEVIELRARCLLFHHHVDQAGKILKEMKTAADYRRTVSARNVEWLLAVRKGALKKSLSLLPQTLFEHDQWAALELYWQLKNVGHGPGIQRLAKAMDKNFSKCAGAITAWHGRRVKRVLRIHTSSKNETNSCINALAAHSLRPYVVLSEIVRVTEQVASKTQHKIAWPETDRAIVEWMKSGRESAVQILDGILARKPEGKPLKYQIARTFLAINMPARAYKIVNQCDTPQSIDICISALRKLKQGKKADAMVKKAIAMSAETDHPALYPYKIRALLKKDLSDDSFSEAKKLSRRAGAWAVPAAKQYIAALERKGELDAIDIYLQRLPIFLPRPAGQDVAWKTKEFTVQYNLNRGKRFHGRANAVIAEMNGLNLYSPLLYYGRGIVKMERTNSKTASKYFKKVFAYDPNFLPAYRLLAKFSNLTPKMQDHLAAAYPSLDMGTLR